MTLFPNIRIVKGEACICHEPGMPSTDCAADLWHDACCDRWRAQGGKEYDTPKEPTTSHMDDRLL